MKKVGDEIAELDNRIREVETNLRDAALNVAKYV